MYVWVSGATGQRKLGSDRVRVIAVRTGSNPAGSITQLKWSARSTTAASLCALCIAS